MKVVVDMVETVLTTTQIEAATIKEETMVEDHPSMTDVAVITISHLATTTTGLTTRRTTKESLCIYYDQVLPFYRRQPYQPKEGGFSSGRPPMHSNYGGRP